MSGHEAACSDEQRDGPALDERCKGCLDVAGPEPPGRLFKLYLQFEGDGKIFHNWDQPENYRISSTIPQFDRSADVWRP